MSSNDQPQERFVEIDASPNTVIDVGGCLIHLQKFTEACLRSAYYDFGSRLSDQLRASNILLERISVKVGGVYQSVGLSEITNARGIPAKLLRPGSQWITGRVRARLVVEFEPEDPGSASNGSPLDDLRKDAG